MQAKMFGQAFGLYRLLEAVKSVNPQVLKILEVDVPPIFSRQATGRNRFVEKLHAFEWNA